MGGRENTGANAPVPVNRTLQIVDDMQAVIEKIA